MGEIKSKISAQQFGYICNYASHFNYDWARGADKILQDYRYCLKLGEDTADVLLSCLEMLEVHRIKQDGDESLWADWHTRYLKDDDGKEVTWIEWFRCKHCCSNGDWLVLSVAEEDVVFSLWREGKIIPYPVLAVGTSQFSLGKWDFDEFQLDFGKAEVRLMLEALVAFFDVKVYHDAPEIVRTIANLHDSFLPNEMPRFTSKSS